MTDFLDTAGLTRVWSKIKALFLLETDKITNQEIDESIILPYVVAQFESFIQIQQVQPSTLCIVPQTSLDLSYDGEIADGDYIGLIFADTEYSTTGLTEYALCDRYGIWDSTYDRALSPIPDDLLNITTEYKYIFEAHVSENDGSEYFTYLTKLLISA